MKRKAIYIAFLAALMPLTTLAQKTPPNLEQLPRRAMDTLATENGEAKVIIYTNNTWEFYYPDQSEMLDREVYHQNWDTTQVFAYRNIELKDLPQTLEFELAGTLDEFHYPIKGKVFSKYGPRGRRNHNGVDIPLSTGEPIFATFPGKVRYSQYNSGGFGNLVIIRHENGLETWYAHLTRSNVQAGDYVMAGAVIGFGGSTGRSRGPHLHFEVRYCDQTFDPEHIIDFETGDLRYQTFVLNKSYFNIRSRASETLEEDEAVFDDTLLAVSTPDEELTSEDILKNLADSEAKATAKAVAAEKTKTDPLYHTIKRGETLGGIARRYGTTVRNLCKLNNIKESTVIKAGKKLRVR